MSHLIPLEPRKGENEKLGSSLSPVSQSLSSMTLGILVIILTQQMTIKPRGLKQPFYFPQILWVWNLGKSWAGQISLGVSSAIELPFDQGQNHLMARLSWTSKMAHFAVNVGCWLGSQLGQSSRTPRIPTHGLSSFQCQSNRVLNGSWLLLGWMCQENQAETAWTFMTFSWKSQNITSPTLLNQAVTSHPDSKEGDRASDLSMAELMKHFRQCLKTTTGTLQ